MTYYRDQNITVRPMVESDCEAFTQGFAAQGWNKPLEQFQRYLQEQQEGVRKVLVGTWQGETAGYTTLLPQATAGPFAGKGWPEVSDFNVLQKFQRRGIGNKIFDVAEDLARPQGTICLGVGLYDGYGTAQRMYVKRGYVFDGSGLWYQEHPQEPGGPCLADDDLILYLSKPLESREFRLLEEKELTPALFRYFDRFQVVEKCWRREEGQWVIREVPFTERWSQEDYQELCRCLEGSLNGGGRVWGCFVDGKLKGFASVEGELAGSRRQYADLTSIHVSADERGKGLGRKLFQLAEEFARQLGAEALYISGHSSVETQAFYQAMGCVDARETLARHVEKEPWDRQLERPLETEE
ncbi:MAG: GNAT family N-acetyltransferase [Acutalibacter sp.]|jgi:GNAT superfamily N-acetyltransferase